MPNYNRIPQPTQEEINQEVKCYHQLVDYYENKDNWVTFGMTSKYYVFHFVRKFLQYEQSVLPYSVSYYNAQNKEQVWLCIFGNNGSNSYSIHGGLSATMLDAVSAFCSYLSYGFGTTATCQINYRRPLFPFKLYIFKAKGVEYDQERERATIHVSVYHHKNVDKILMDGDFKFAHFADSISRRRRKAKL